VESPEHTLSQGLLANYLEKHKDEMTVAWVERMRKSRAIPTDSMTVPEIVDHVPQIFDAVIQALRKHRSDEAMDQIAETSAWHVVIRWQQHYDLHAVLREISLLRTELIYHLQVFQEAHPEFGIAQRLFASKTIHRILDEIAYDATEKFLKLTRGKTEPYA